MITINGSYNSPFTGSVNLIEQVSDSMSPAVHLKVNEHKMPHRFVVAYKHLIFHRNCQSVNTISNQYGCDRCVSSTKKLCEKLRLYPLKDLYLQQNPLKAIAHFSTGYAVKPFITWNCTLNFCCCTANSLLVVASA